MITYEGRVYMSHGRSLSLPGPHDTVDGVGDCPVFDHCSYWCNWSHMEAGCLVGFGGLVVDLITIWWWSLFGVPYIGGESGYDLVWCLLNVRLSWLISLVCLIHFWFCRWRSSIGCQEVLRGNPAIAFDCWWESFLFFYLWCLSCCRCKFWCLSSA